MDTSVLLNNFSIALTAAGVDTTKIQFEVLDRSCPHIPAALPRGKMAIYIFRLANEVLKVGKVGPNSNARFQTQHYSPGSSKSNLAKSLLDDASSDCRELAAEEIGPWMRAKLHRVDILLNADAGMPVLSYLEAFLHCRLRPRYEGFKSQKG